MSEFKVGDHIVIDQKYDKTFMPVLQIISEGKNYFYCNDGQVHKSQMEQWRKAEPEEIAAGHRIDNTSNFKDASEEDQLQESEVEFTQCNDCGYRSTSSADCCISCGSLNTHKDAISYEDWIRD